METTQQTIGEIVSQNFKTTDVFTRHKIDFCCGGQRTLEEVCATQSLDPDSILHELKQVEKEGDFTKDYNRWTLDFLIDYILNVHHTYMRESLPVISAYAAKVVQAHGDRHPELLHVQQLFLGLADELEMHLIKEEQILFPFIQEMLLYKKNNKKPPYEDGPSIDSPIRVMEMEHDTAGTVLKEISRLTDSYNVPKDACETYQVLYKKLEEFEQDLHKHVHLENNILHPKAKALEAELMK